jgi:hypothetical protein
MDGPKELRQFALTYQPIIDFLEGGGNNRDLVEGHPLLEQFLVDVKARWPDVYDPYLGGADQLEVAEVDGDVYIKEYDGSESYMERHDDEGWL